MINAIRNNRGIFINVNVFREEALHFLKHGYYCPFTIGSPNWKEYWIEQQRRCLEGYEVGNVKITGNHYYYLNFVQIKAKSKDSNRKVIRFPDFWDGDYNFFWALEIAEKGISKKAYKDLKLNVKIKDYALSGGRHLMVLKSRRKGYSYKSASVLSNTYLNVRNSLSLIGSFDKKYSEDAFRKVKSAIDFADDNTGFKRSRLVDTRNRIKSGYLDVTSGNAIEKGYLSEIETLTYQDNPDAARGKDATKIILEEMGTFPNAIEAFNATEPSVKDGDILTGIMIMYGTSSSKEIMTQPFQEMFYNPDVYRILPFSNIWDENSEDYTCAMFHPVYLNKTNYYDENGNSDIKGAIESEMVIRETKKYSSTALNQYIVEYPITPSEAFMSGKISIFPTAELTAQLRKVTDKKWYIKKSQAVDLVWEKNNVIMKPIFDKRREPLYFKNQKYDNEEGVVVIYEAPLTNIKRNFYKIGYDPYAQDQSKSESLGAIYVFKPINKDVTNGNKIVAQYVGRPREADDMNEIALKLAILYNTEVMYENMFIHTKNYFRRKRMLNRLAAQPDEVISKSIKHSTVSRIYGIHMNEQLKDSGEKYIKDWLLGVTNYDENGDPVLNLEYIYDAGLLEELIAYNRKGNFDRVMAMMMTMFQLEEDRELENKEKEISPILEWTNYLDNLLK